jgi:hypothetical protein
MFEMFLVLLFRTFKYLNLEIVSDFVIRASDLQFVWVRNCGIQIMKKFNYKFLNPVIS